jgi:tetratricopeptide (TPR) repeat protein
VSFVGALPGIVETAGSIVGADQTPWLVGGCLGWALGLWMLGREKLFGILSSPAAVTVVVFIGAAMSIGYYQWVDSPRDTAMLAVAQRLYNQGGYQECVARLKPFLAISKANSGLLLEVGDISLIAGDTRGAAHCYDQFEKFLSTYGMPSNTDPPMARAETGRGNILYFERDYKGAVKLFESAAKRWPGFKDPECRMAIAYVREGNYAEAIKTGERAVRKLHSNAAVLHIALAEAYLKTGRPADAAKSMKKARKADGDLAARIGKYPDAWSNAVSKITARDLKFPLESGFVDANRR